MRKITIKANEEYRVKIIDTLDKSEFFYDAYNKAKHELEDIILETDYYWNNLNKKHNNMIFDFSNNIIAFTGDRGQGKSSAMLSFSNFLSKENMPSNKEFLGKKICGNKFTVLDRIDPTKFEEKDNIILIILSKIFDAFCVEWDNSEKTLMSNYNELLNMFQSCYNEILTIKSINENKINDYSFGSELDRLGDIGDSNNLKKHLWDLIQKYFEFKNQCQQDGVKKNNNFLVIQLDDTDLNAKKAYKIVEDVRKYFMMPNVIILMAIDITQLTKAIEQFFIADYETMNNFHTKNVDEYHKIAVKYIDKLIPGNRKIVLPKITPETDEYGEKVRIEYLSSEPDDKDKNKLLFLNTKNEQIYDVQELVLRYIYEKTGLIFIKPNTYVHDIIPDTMREFVNFLSVLYDMKSIDHDYSSIENLKVRIKNLESFETYFIEVWIPNYIQRTYIEVVNNYIEASWITKNKQLINDLRIIMYSTGADYKSRAIENIKYIDNKNTYSLFDVRKVLMTLEENFPQKEVYKFTFAIRTLCSIYLNKIICNQMIHELSNEEYNNEMLIDFIGGDIFGDESNEFVRSEERSFARGLFEINSPNTNEFKEKMKKLFNKNSVVYSIFGNFCFPKSEGYQYEYKTPYRTDNGNHYSSLYKFNVSYPIIFLCYPKLLEGRIGKAENATHFIENINNLTSIRLQCFRIVSNLEYANYISKQLKNRTGIKSDQWSFSDHIKNMYERINECTNKLTYYNFDRDWSSFINLIKKYSNSINDLYDLYKETERENANKRIRLSMRIRQIVMLRNTKTFEILRGKVEGLISSLEYLNQTYKDDMLYYFITELLELEDDIRMYSGPLDAENRAIYQGEYNRIVRNLRDEYVF